MKNKHFLILITIILGIIVCLAFLGCNDNGKIDPGTSIDSTTKPAIDTTATIAKFFNAPLENPYAYPIELNVDVQALINNGGERIVISFPKGDFYFSSTLNIFNKSVWLLGTNGTRFIFAPGVTGLILNRDKSIYKSKIANIEFASQGGTANGLEIHSIIDLENVTVSRFGGIGISLTADIEKEKTNVINSTLINCEVQESGSHGYYMHGGDASSIGFYNCSARDNGGYGFWDDSFLGNAFFNCLAHANKLGHYRADNGNNRSTFYGSYGEQDSPPDMYGGVSRVFGGLHGWQVSIGPDGKYFYPESPETNYVGGGYLVKDNAKVETH